MRFLLKELLGDVKIEKWRYFDNEGYVRGYPSMIEVDLVIKNKEHILVEIKSSTSDSDVIILRRIGDLYEKVIGIKPRLMLLTIYATDKAKESATALRVELHTD